MSNAKITVDNVVDRDFAVLSTASTVLSSFPLSFLQNMDRAKWTRIMPVSSIVDIKLTWGGEGFPVNMFSINRINAEPADTVQLLGYAASNWTGTDLINMTPVVAVPSLTLGDLAFGIDPLGSNLYDSFLGQKMHTTYFPEVTIQSAILRLDWRNNAQGWLDISRFFLGKAYELEYNPVYGQNLRWNHNGVKNKRGKGGGPMNQRGSAWRELEFDFKATSTADQAMWLAAARLLMESQDFHFAVFPDGTDEQIRDYSGFWIFDKMPGVVSSGPSMFDISTLLVET